MTLDIPLYKQVQERLMAPFPLELVNLKPGAVARGKNSALAMAHGDTRAYMLRLDEVCPGEWSDETISIQVTPKKIIVATKVTVMGVTHSDVGEHAIEDENGATSATAQSFKRACAKHGLGRYLYDLPQMWFDYDEVKKRWATPQRSMVSALYAKAGITKAHIEAGQRPLLELQRDIEEAGEVEEANAPAPKAVGSADPPVTRQSREMQFVNPLREITGELPEDSPAAALMQALDQVGYDMETANDQRWEHVQFVSHKRGEQFAAALADYLNVVDLPQFASALFHGHLLAGDTTAFIIPATYMQAYVDWAGTLTKADRKHALEDLYELWAREAPLFGDEEGVPEPASDADVVAVLTGMCQTISTSPATPELKAALKTYGNARETVLRLAQTDARLRVLNLNEIVSYFHATKDDYSVLVTWVAATFAAEREQAGAPKHGAAVPA
jgi:hypothetical protein